MYESTTLEKRLGVLYERLGSECPCWLDRHG